MKVNAKNAMIGLLMTTGVIGTTIAYIQQKNNKVETHVENAVNVDSTLKTKSDVATAIFKAEQARKKADFLLNGFNKASATLNDIDVHSLNTTMTDLSDALREELNSLEEANNAMIKSISNN